MVVHVYIDGVWDLMHVAHIHFMENVRKAAARECGVNDADVKLIVGIISDSDVESYKRTPIVTEDHRAYTVSALKCVDEIVPNSPLVLTDDFLDRHDIDLCYHGDDSQQVEFFRVCRERGIMRYLKYDVANTGLSTSALIRRIREREHA